MKLPFEFGVKLIFRLVIPGFILSLGLLPLLNLILKSNGWSDKAEYAFIILIILLGWLVTISDMGIYMLLEGRRFWPRRLREYALKREKARLKKVLSDIENDDELTRLEAFFDLRNFWTSLEGDYQIILPSRLGNLIYAFERHPRRTYGIDPIFYWPRIWLKLDKDVREEIDNMQALADSTAYTTCALLISGCFWLLYVLAKLGLAILLWVNALLLSSPLQQGLPGRVVYDSTLAYQFLPRKIPALFIALIFLLASAIVYRLSLRLHAQFGELYKSVFDLNVGTLNVMPVIEELARLSSESPSVCLNKNLERREQFIVAARYLQYYRYRCPGCNAVLKPGEIKDHQCPVASGDVVEARE